MKSSETAIPVQASERIQFVDVLRGFAILGILLFNVGSFAGRSFALRDWHEPLDRAIILLVDFFVQAKFYSLFSFLFGWGMAMQMSLASAKGVKFVPLYLRRLLVLLLFGSLHSIFLWNGDILTMYAILGIPLLLIFRNRSEKTILIAAGVSLLTAILMLIPGEMMDSVRGWCASTSNCFRPENALSQSLYNYGNYFEITQLRFQGFFNALWWFPCYFGSVFAMFLLGLYTGKRNIFRDIQHYFPLVRKVMWSGLLVGLLFNGIFVYMSIVQITARPYAQLIRVGTRIIGAPALTLFYMTVIILLFQKEQWRARLTPLAYVGRMALSNYIFQSVLATFIFYGYGLGLYGETDPTFGALLAISIYLMQIRFSQWWFERYQFGPLEWLWRTLSYARRHPFSARANYSDYDVKTHKTVQKTQWLRLGAAWMMLLAWALGLWFWQMQRQEGSQISPLELALRGTPSVAPGIPDQADAAIVASGPISTPVVKPLAYRPGAAAASGDLWTLANAFDVERALANIESLSAARFNGRATGSPGGRPAGDFLAQQFARYGLQPAGDANSYFQTFPIHYTALASMPGLRIEGLDGRTQNDYQLYRDYAPVLDAYAGAGSAEGLVVWVNDCSRADFNKINVVDKIVFCRMGALHEIGRNAIENGAVGLLLLTDPDQFPPDYSDALLPAWVPGPLPAYRVYATVAEDILRGSGVSIADLSIIFSPFELQTKVQMQLTTVSESACSGSICQGRNILGVIPGRDPAFQDQIIILSANYDHLGSSPDGTIWNGANDNASGVSVLLEIARNWQAQGYQPRATTLFALWDGTTLGALGSQYFVAHPNYPLDTVITVLHLDQLGAGEDWLTMDGTNSLQAQLSSAAEVYGVEIKNTNNLDGDHSSFLDAFLPSQLLTWVGENSRTTYSQRPGDSLESIVPEKLESAGKIVALTLLSAIEGQSAIDELLSQRATAFNNQDLTAFLATASSEQRADDIIWFADAQTLAPINFKLTAENLTVGALRASALVTMQFEVFDTPQNNNQASRLVTLTAPIQFSYNENGWRWDGADLVLNAAASQPGGNNPDNPALPSFEVLRPADKSEGLEGLAQIAAERYDANTQLMGLANTPASCIELHFNNETLAANTAVSLPRSQSTWVGPGVLKMTYSTDMLNGERFATGLVQLMLANLGINQQAAPWLWEGLPLVLQARKDQANSQEPFIATLQNALLTEPGSPLPSDAASWAALDYLRRQLGWQGLGALIADLGAACRDGHCQNEDAINNLLTQRLVLNQTTFETAWQQSWEQRLSAAQTNLDSILAGRSDAALKGDANAFLRTVDPATPTLLAEEMAWFDDLANQDLQAFSLTGVPSIFYDDGSFLAALTMSYQLGGIDESWGQATVALSILFKPTSDSGYLWAGSPMAVLPGERIQVRFPQGEETLAGEMLANAEKLYAQLANQMGVARPKNLILNLYTKQHVFRTSIALAYPPLDWAGNYSANDQAIKLLLQPDTTATAYQAVLASQLLRQLLYQIGVNSEWLLTGISSYLAWPADQGANQMAAAMRLHALTRALRDEQAFSLADFPALHTLSTDGYEIALPEAWDATRYLAETYGRDALFQVLLAQGHGRSLDAALRSVLGQSIENFESDWQESYTRGHAKNAWVDLALTFNPDQVQRHITFLTAPALAGRLAGTPGAEIAANYVAEQFARYGLNPEVQTFPIRYRTYLQAPVFDIQVNTVDGVHSFVYRQDFLVLQNSASSDPISGELIWVADENYTSMELDGKIAVRNPSRTIDEEIALAVAHGASALILVGDKSNDAELLAKYPIASDLPENAIPVFELTRDGFTLFLEIIGQTKAAIFNTPPAILLGAQAALQTALSESILSETSNVIGLLPGSDPLLSQQYIIVGAHYDHVGDDPDYRFSGANDNASGVGVMLEIIRLWQINGYHPQRSVIFIAWGAQESGQLGSTYYVENPRYPLEATYAMLQLDAVGGGEGYHLEAKGNRDQDGLLLFAIQQANDLVDGRLQISMQENPTHLPFEGFYSPTALFDRARIGNTSDQAPFRDAGLQTLLLVWRGASEENWSDEIADEINPDRLYIAGKMITTTLMMLTR